MKHQQQDNRYFLIGLAVTLAAMALGLTMLTAAFIRQSATVEETAKLQTDSVTFMTFQFEREFLRFRSELESNLNSRIPQNWPNVQLRYDILLSRSKLLTGNPSIQNLKSETEYNQTLPKINALLNTLEPLMDSPWENTTELQSLLHKLHDLGPDVQAMSLAADRLITHQLENKVNRLREQNRWIVWLVTMQVFVLLLASAGLWIRHLRLTKERMALEALNQELLEATQAAERANRAKSHFLANMSHELRTPFNGMLGMIQLLEESNLSKEQRDQLHTAKISAQHLLNILNDILDMSALDAGKLKIKPDCVQMQPLVEEIHNLFVAQGALKGLNMPLQFEEGTPEWVLADPTRVRQILLNLLNNAVKFTQQGTVSLHVGFERKNNEVEWEIKVQDTGIGIEEDKLNSLFQRFQQADDSATRRFGGTGLGLDISRKLARMMHGDIVVTSIPRQGSIFTVTLRTPLAQAPRDINPPTSVRVGDVQNHLNVLTSRRFPSLEVLVAEDHPINQKFVGMLLEKLGHHVTFVGNGAEALKLAQAQQFDVILMDVHMPEMDGLESARMIRQLPAPHGKVPIIALSADVMNEAKDRAIEAGMTAFVSKPVQKTELETAIRSCLPA
jgi:two-component system, sensor histidine kinase